MNFWKNSALIYLLILFGCNTDEPQDQWLKSHDAVCFMVFTPDCPLAQNYSSPFLDLAERYSDSNLTFVGVMPGDLYSEEDIREYIEQYDFTTEVYRDKEYQLCKNIGAEVTPHFTLMDRTGIVYSGALDNWIVKLGTYRNRPDSFYLEDAIKGWKNATHDFIKSRKALGCYIEYPHSH